VVVENGETNVRTWTPESGPLKFNYNTEVEFKKKADGTDFITPK